MAAAELDDKPTFRFVAMGPGCFRLSVRFVQMDGLISGRVNFPFYPLGCFDETADSQIRVNGTLFLERCLLYGARPEPEATTHRGNRGGGSRRGER